jgi:phenylalanyl-tRNA synthetase beta chain
MADDEAILRTSLLPSMLRTIQWNLNRGIRDVQLCEIGKTYAREGERRSLILAATGALREKNVHESERVFDFFDLKGDAETILDTFGFELTPDGHSPPEYYHPGRTLRSGDLVVLGELHPDYADLYKFKHRVYVAEIDVELLLESKGGGQIQAIPKFPSIRRDLSLLLNKGTRYGDVERAVLALRIPELFRVQPFDRLDAGSFPESKYALAISLMYQSADRTLTDDEVDNFTKAILDSLKQRLGAELRQ